MIEEIMNYNDVFVERKEYEPYRTSKYPDKKVAILTCMDTRLTELLPAALGIKNGDAKIIKNAGGVISHPYGSAVRSLLIAIYALGVEEILVIGHTDCGVQHMDSNAMIERMQERGVSIEDIEAVEYHGIELHSWLDGFTEVEEAVTSSVNLLKNHPLIPKDIAVYGFVMDSITGQLEAAGQSCNQSVS